ncbi:glycosyltransferase [Candidatus Deianiraea vastatrix]|uniref:Glycosyltransferase n=1 Tax=Candidatus Deianiraea vastatrix TaxID=2163644 RepID=A0A5B8XJ08_9RICK|nr:glycosyltransferase family 4 protein [Candidatus Deianiraea vastatrix]QED23874.1 Putative glycosyltransferase [Candidatus Deianiraea vastatrix]
MMNRIIRKIKNYIKFIIKSFLYYSLKHEFSLVFYKTLLIIKKQQLYIFKLLSKKKSFTQDVIENNIDYKITSAFELIITQLEGGGVQSVVDMTIKLNPSTLYIVIFLKDEFTCVIKKYFNDEVVNVSNAASSEIALKNFINQKSCKKITIHHLLKSYLPEMINVLKTQNSLQVPIYTHLHDFFYICPTIFLMNNKSKFCNLDAPEKCHKCSIIQAAMSPFLNFRQDIHPLKFVNIQAWRDSAKILFEISSKIIAYSQTTVDLYKKAFVFSDNKIEISDALFSFSKHFVKLPEDYNSFKTDTLNIAMIGTWHYIKGSNIFCEMQKIIDNNQTLYKNVNLHFIGKGFYEIGSKIKNLGPYNSNNFAQIIHSNSISVCIIPSILSETFSIATQDCLEVGIPVVTFGVGAMKERLQNNPNALVINEISNESVSKLSDIEMAKITLDRILNFAAKKRN